MIVEYIFTCTAVGGAKANNPECRVKAYWAAKRKMTEMPALVKIKEKVLD